MAGGIDQSVAPNQPAASKGLVIDLPASIIDPNGGLLDQIVEPTVVNILSEVVSDRGEHFFQIQSGRFILKNSVTIDPKLWHDAETAGAKQFNLGAENINQIWWGMPNGCEPAALLEGLHLTGHALNLDYLGFLKEMPRAADFNPNHGFGGEPDQDVPGHFEAIFPMALVPWAGKYTVVRDLSGTDAETFQLSIQHKKPIVAYVTVGFEDPQWGDYSFGRALSNNHAVLVDGYFGQLLHLSDPIDGRYWISLDRFKRAYDARHWAVEID